MTKAVGGIGRSYEDLAADALASWTETTFGLRTGARQRTADTPDARPRSGRGPPPRRAAARPRTSRRRSGEVRRSGRAPGTRGGRCSRSGAGRLL